MHKLKSIFKVKQNADLILRGSIFKALLMLAIPIIMTNFLQHMYNLTDTYWLGKIGRDPLAAISLVTPIQSTMMSFGQGITMAGTILMSQYIGANKKIGAKIMANQIFTGAMIFSIVSSSILFIFVPSITAWMGASGDLASMGNLYLRIVIIDAPLLFMINIFGAVNQSQGNTIYPMLLNLLGIVINMILDPLFIMVFNWGIGGAAIATLGAKIPSAIIAMKYLCNQKNPIHLELRRMKPRLEYMKKILTIGLPTAIGNSAMQFGFVLMSKNVLVFGNSAMAAYGVGNRINGIITLPANALGAATSTIVGQNLGAGQIKRAEKGYKWAVGCGMSFLFVAGMILARPPVSRAIAMILTNDSEVIPMAVDFVSIMATWCFTNALYSCTMSLLNAAGRTKITMLVEASRLWVFRFATIWFCQRILNMGVESVWYSVVVSNGISAIILLMIYFSRIWEKDTLGIRTKENLDKKILIEDK